MLFSTVFILGKHLDSLRQLRWNRDNIGKITAKKSLPPVQDRFSVFTQPESEEKVTRFF